MAEKTWRKSAVRIKDIVSTAEASADQINIQVTRSVPDEATDDFAYNINIMRDLIDKTADAKHFYNENSGTVVVKTNSSDFNLTEGDIITITGTYL